MNPFFLVFSNEVGRGEETTGSATRDLRLLNTVKKCSIKQNKLRPQIPTRSLIGTSSHVIQTKYTNKVTTYEYRKNIQIPYIMGLLPIDKDPAW